MRLTPRECAFAVCWFRSPGSTLSPSQNLGEMTHVWVLLTDVDWMLGCYTHAP
jgi:hypothetical protein